MDIHECYNKFQGDYNDASSRMMNDALIERFMLKFPGDTTMDLLNKAVDEGDTPAAFRAAHTLKGIAGNLSFTRLCRAASALTEQLRDKDNTVKPDPALIAEVKDAYWLVIDTIAEYCAEKN